MPPALHPRSSLTLSLFTSTLAVSFLVVGLPHLVPCPVQPHSYADDGTPRPRRRRRKVEDGAADANQTNSEVLTTDLESRSRECPVPKPGGLVGQMLGLKAQGEAETERPTVRIETIEKRERRIGGEVGDGKG